MIMKKWMVLAFALLVVSMVFASPINDSMKSPKDNIKNTLHRDLGQNPYAENMKTDVTDRSVSVWLIPKAGLDGCKTISILETAITSYKDILPIIPAYLGSPFLEVSFLNPADQMSVAATYFVLEKDAIRANSTDDIYELAVVTFNSQAPENGAYSGNWLDDRGN